MSALSILIVDDEEKFRQLLSRIIGLEGYTIFQAGDIKDGQKILSKEQIDIILTDVKLPDGNGIEFLQKIKQTNNFCEVIVMTAYGTIHDGVKAIKEGAIDYFTKGDDNEQIVPAINRVADKIRLQKRVIDLERKLEGKFGFDIIIGNSKCIKDTILLAQKVAPTDSTVLLEGETGVGKELFAQALHYASARKTKAFVAVNCSAFPKDLLESELFGHKKGAYTGAVSDKKGLFEEASEGTLFLDEMGEMNLELQAKLLRVLETQSFIKVGDSKPTKVNVRIVAATNRDLKIESEAGNFRSDLYYRLSTFKITIPSLRERAEDIESLANHFIGFYAIKIKKRVTGMDKEFLSYLKQNPWKGNIRELKNIIERAVILSESDTLGSELLPTDIIEHTGTLDLSLAGAEKAHIKKILAQVNGNKTKAAEILSIAVTTLYRKIEEYKL